MMRRHATVLWQSLGLKPTWRWPANDSRYTLRAQDGTLRHTSPDLKMYHSQIEQFVAQAGQEFKLYHNFNKRKSWCGGDRGIYSY